MSDQKEQTEQQAAAPPQQHEHEQQQQQQPPKPPSHQQQGQPMLQQPPPPGPGGPMMPPPPQFQGAPPGQQQPMYGPYGGQPYPAGPGYGMPGQMMFVPMMFPQGVPMMPHPGMPGGPPPPPQQQSLPPQQHTSPQQPEQQQQQQEQLKGSIESQDKVAKNETEPKESGKPGQSWAQIARDPDQEKALDGGQEQQQQQQQQQQMNQQRQQQHGHRGGSSNANVLSRSSIREQLEYFQKAQHLFLQSLLYQQSPWVMLPSFINISQEAHMLFMQGGPIAPDQHEFAGVVKHLRSIYSFNHLAYVNSDMAYDFKVWPNAEFFVVHCEKEMDVFKFIKRSAWTIDSPESERLLEIAFGKSQQTIFFFTIPSLKKLVGCAEVMVPPLIMQNPNSDEKTVNLRWRYIRDVQFFHLKTVFYLNNPDFRKSRLEERERAAAAAAAAATASASTEESEGDATGEAQDETPPSDAPDSDAKPANEQEGDKAKQEDQAQEDKEAGKGGAKPTKDPSLASKQGEGAASTAAPVKKSTPYDGPPFYKISQESGRETVRILEEYSFHGGILIDFAEYQEAEDENRAPNMSALLCGGLKRPLNSGRSGRGRGGGRGGYSMGGRGGRGGSGRSGRGGYNSHYHGNNDHLHHSRDDRSEGRSERSNGRRNDDDGGHHSNHRSGGSFSGRSGGRGGRGRGRTGGSSAHHSSNNNSNSADGGKGDSSGGTNSGNSGRSRGGRARSDRGGDRGGSERSGGGSFSRKVEGSDGSQTLRSQYTFEIKSKKKSGVAPVAPQPVKPQDASKEE